MMCTMFDKYKLFIIGGIFLDILLIIFYLNSTENYTLTNCDFNKTCNIKECVCGNYTIDTYPKIEVSKDTNNCYSNYDDFCIDLLKVIKTKKSANLICSTFLIINNILLILNICILYALIQQLQQQQQEQQPIPNVIKAIVPRYIREYRTVSVREMSHYFECNICFEFRNTKFICPNKLCSAEICDKCYHNPHIINCPNCQITLTKNNDL